MRVVKAVVDHCHVNAGPQVGGPSILDVDVFARRAAALARVVQMPLAAVQGVGVTGGDSQLGFIAIPPTTVLRGHSVARRLRFGGRDGRQGTVLVDEEWLSFIRNIRNLLVCSCWASSSKTRERNNTRDIRACVYSTVPENGNGEMKIKREFVRNGPRSVHRPFNYRSPPVFFKRAPVEQIVRGNFFLTPTILQDCYIQMTTAT